MSFERKIINFLELKVELKTDISYIVRDCINEKVKNLEIQIYKIMYKNDLDKIKCHGINIYRTSDEIVWGWIHKEDYQGKWLNSRIETDEEYDEQPMDKNNWGEVKGYRLVYNPFKVFVEKNWLKIEEIIDSINPVSDIKEHVIMTILADKWKSNRSRFVIRKL